MDIKVLGPLEAYQNGRTIAPSAAKPRQILALLALQVGQVVTVPALIEELWGMNPPRSALTTLQTYIMQLRRRIEAALSTTSAGGAKEVLVTRYGGYMLDLTPEDVDVQRYERLAVAGTRALEQGDNEAGSPRPRPSTSANRRPRLCPSLTKTPSSTATSTLRMLALSSARLTLSWVSGFVQATTASVITPANNRPFIELHLPGF